MNRIRRSTLALGTAGPLCLLSALAGCAAPSASTGGGAAPAGPAASASPASTAGAASPAGAVSSGPASPPLGAAPFKIGQASSAGGSVALEPNGDLVVVYGIRAGHGKTVVCLLRRGGRQCWHTTTLSPLAGDSTFGEPQVFVPTADHVVVLQETCCDTTAAGGDLLFSSSNGGMSFGPPVRVGKLSVSAAALVGGHIVFTAGDDRTGLQVESIPVTASGPPAPIALARAKTAYDVGVGQYQGGALIASDYLGSNYTTHVDYAARGTDFGASASYHGVGSFPGERLLAISGGALLTIEGTGGAAVLLRLFNGSGFGPAQAVPGTAGGGPEWFTVDQDPSGMVHVFSERGLAGSNYHLIEVSTSTGAQWSSPVDLGNAIQSAYLDAGLDSLGRGLVLGTDPAWGYPVPG